MSDIPPKVKFEFFAGQPWPFDDLPVRAPGKALDETMELDVDAYIKEMDADDWQEMIEQDVTND